MSGLVMVPTCADLGRRGLAVNRERSSVVRETGETKTDTRWEITPEGVEEIRAAMAHNARTLATDAELRREEEAAAFRTTDRTDGDR